jgi:hypothetical protein
VNIRTFGLVVHTRKVLIITGTSSKIIEMTTVYAFLNIQKYEIWPTNTFVHFMFMVPGISDDNNE